MGKQVSGLRCGLNYSPHQDRVRLCSNNTVDGCFRVRLRFRCHFRTVCDPFGEDKFHIGNADKAQERGQIRRHQVRWSIFVDPTAAGNNDGFFTRYQTFRTILGIAESNACTCNQVKIVFQLSRDVEVIHRCRNNDNVMGFQLGNQLIGKCQSFLLTRSQRRIARTQSANQFAIQYRN